MIPQQWRLLRPGEVEGGSKLSGDLARRVWRFARPYQAKILAYLGLVVIVALLGAVPPLLYKWLIDDAIGAANLHLLNLLALALLGVAGAGAVVQVAARWLSARVGEGVIFDLRAALFDHVQRMPVAFFTRTQTGALLSRLNNDVIGAQRAFTEVLGSVVQTVTGIVAALAVMFSLEWRLTLLSLAIVPVFVAPTRRMARVLRRLTRQQMDNNASMNTQMTERFQVGGALLVKLFGHPKAELERFSDRAAAVRDLGVRSALYSRAFFMAFGLVAALGTALVYWLGGRMVIGNVITLGTIVAFAAYLTQLYAPITLLTNARLELVSSFVSFERVFEVLEFPPAITDRPGAEDLVACRGEVEFERVWFRYPPAAEVSLRSLEADTAEAGEEQGAWVLQDVSFTVAPGQMVALVGPSGAGKTTTSALVPRLYDVTKGSVRVDGADVRDLTLGSLGAAVGIVTQDPHLFHDTIRANLRYARPDATEHQIMESAKAAQIHEVFASLPDGYETTVGERGYRLSGGEKQRLAIARLLLKDPAIMILDEATAHLDSESELAIQRALAEALSGRSSLVIAHRLSTVVNADLILVLDGGRIVERGSHAELVGAGGLYEELYRTQFLRRPLRSVGPLTTRRAADPRKAREV